LGRDAGDTRLGEGETDVRVEITSAVGGGVVPLPQEAEIKAKRSPKKRQKLRFIFPFTSEV